MKFSPRRPRWKYSKRKIVPVIAVIQKKSILIIVAFSFIEGVASPSVTFGEANAFGNAKTSSQAKDAEHDRL